MGNFIRKAIEKRKHFLINKLIGLGFFKKNDIQLFELTLTELEAEYQKLTLLKKVNL